MRVTLWDEDAMLATCCVHVWRFARLCLVVMVALACFGCLGFGPPPPLMYEEGQVPRFGVLYYPDGPSMIRQLAAPIPDYQGWTDERMERDLDRMAAAGVDFALVATEGDDLDNPFRRARLTRFVEIASRAPVRTRVVFWCRAASVDQAGGALHSFYVWVVKSGVGAMPGYAKESGRPMIVLDEGFGGFTGNHPALHLRRTGAGTGQWVVGPGASDDGVCVVNVAAAQALVFACPPGMSDEDRRLLLRARDRGRPLRRGLWEAFAARSETILISSWNDFATGDFVEPNGLDGRMLLNGLAEEIGRVRRHAVTKAAR